MLKQLKGNSIGEEILSVFVQKSGLLLVVLADALASAYLGELAAFGVASTLVAHAGLLAVIAGPWAGAAITEGALALRCDQGRAARIFGSYAVNPLYLACLATCIVATESGIAATYLGSEAALYLRWALIAKAVGHLPLAAIKALRKGGHTRDIVSSTWILAGVNCLGNALSIWQGWGLEGLALSWAAGELLAGWIPVLRATRRGLLAVPSVEEIRFVASKTTALYVAAVPSAAVAILRAVVFATTPSVALATFVAAQQGYQIANNLSSQLAMVGMAAAQRGAEGGKLAYDWSVYVRLASLPLAFWVGGWQSLVLLALGHYALMAWCRLMEVAGYRRHSIAGSSSDVIWACMVGVALACGWGGCWWLFAARWLQQGVYFLVARTR